MKFFIPLATLLVISCQHSSRASQPASHGDHAPEQTPAQGGDAPRPAFFHAPADGATMFTVYDAFLSPAQEPGEESDAPRGLGLTATAASTPRKQRASRGYGQIRFARDLSQAYVDVQLEGVRAEDIMMFHIHCGPPGVLGPIIVDLAKSTRELQEDLADGRLSIAIDNDSVVFVKDMPKGLKPRLPEGCPVDQGFLNQVKTIAGVEYLARQGVLYFNLHTKAHTFYGEMRGQIHAVKD
jgi:hypothetical protein